MAEEITNDAQRPPLRLGIVGLGRAAFFDHLPALRKLPDLFRVVAVCDLLKERRDLVEKDLPNLRTYRRIDDMLDDGNHHFIIVEKDGKLIAMGLYNGLSEPAADVTELSVTAYPQYREAFEAAQASDEDSPLKHLKYVYTQLEHDIVIREYDFPREWLDPAGSDTGAAGR